jgi:hypothetical protein
MSLVRLLHEWAVGPLAWAAFAACGLGLAWRLPRVLARGRAVGTPMWAGLRARWTLLSLLHWLLPANRSARAHPLVAAAGVALHLALLGLMLLAPGHAVLWEHGFGLAWPSLGRGPALALGLAGVAALAFFVLRRGLDPEVRFLSGPRHWLMLALAGAPLLSGVARALGLGPAEPLLVLHMLSGELLLALLPFTRLSHAAFFFLSRALAGANFGKNQVGAW